MRENKILVTLEPVGCGTSRRQAFPILTGIDEPIDFGTFEMPNEVFCI